MRLVLVVRRAFLCYRCTIPTGLNIPEWVMPDYARYNYKLITAWAIHLNESAIKPAGNWQPIFCLKATTVPFQPH